VFERIVPAWHNIFLAALCGVAAGMLVIVLTKYFGIRKIRFATMIPLVCLLFFLLNLNGHTLDLNYSARPLARQIAEAAPGTATVAVNNGRDVRRDLIYGLAFYRNRAVVHYDTEGVPDGEHVLVIPTHQADQLPQLLPGRVYQPLFVYETRGLSVYKVYPR
jgi:hypothetical protein